MWHNRSIALKKSETVLSHLLQHEQDDRGEDSRQNSGQDDGAPDPLFVLLQGRLHRPDDGPLAPIEVVHLSLAQARARAADDGSDARHRLEVNQTVLRMTKNYPPTSQNPNVIY